MILNGIYDGDIQRFERVSHEQTEAVAWNLYRVRSAVVKRWRLQRYLFDEQILHIQIGLSDPLAAVNLDVADLDPFAMSPGLVLPGWTLEQPGAYGSSISLMSELGRPLGDSSSTGRVAGCAYPAPQPPVCGTGLSGLHARHRVVLHEFADYPQPRFRPVLNG